MNPQSSMNSRLMNSQIAVSLLANLSASWRYPRSSGKRAPSLETATTVATTNLMTNATTNTRAAGREAALRRTVVSHRTVSESGDFIERPRIGAAGRRLGRRSSSGESNALPVG